MSPATQCQSQPFIANGAMSHMAFKTATLFAVIFFTTACMPLLIQEKRAERLYRDGQHLAEKGEKRRAFEKFSQSLALAQEAGFQAGVAHNYNEMAIIYTSEGAYVRARDILEKAVVIYKDLDMAPEVSKSLNNTALTFLREGDYAGAIHQYEELLAWDRETGNRLGMGVVLNNMGQVYDRHLGDHEMAQKKYAQALKILEETGNQNYMSIVKKNIAEGNNKRIK